VQDAPDEAAELDVEFERGVPTSIDGEELSLADLKRASTGSPVATVLAGSTIWRIA